MQAVPAAVKSRSCQANTAPSSQYKKRVLSKLLGVDVCEVGVGLEGVEGAKARMG